MRLLNINGKLVYKRVGKKLINWSKKSRSKLQTQVKVFLKKFWKNHIVYEEFPVYGSRMKVDLINMTKRIAVEVQGAQHDQFNKFFHGNSRAKYLRSITRDYQKRQWLEKNNFTVLEIVPEDMTSLSKRYIREKFDINI